MLDSYRNFGELERWEQGVVGARLLFALAAIALLIGFLLAPPSVQSVCYGVAIVSAIGATVIGYRGQQAYLESNSGAAGGD